MRKKFKSLKNIGILNRHIIASKPFLKKKNY
jgi:hypothetical protein